MIDTRNIIIKVKYPFPGRGTENFTPKIITEWNVKRIALAAGVLIFILAALVSAINSMTQNNNSDNAELVVNTIEETIIPQVDIKGEGVKKADISGQVAAKNFPPGNSAKEANKKNKPTVDVKLKKAIRKPDGEKVTKDAGHSKFNHNVARAVLTYDINNKEPKGEIARTVNVTQKKPTWIYYFTELKSMKGSRIYHEWSKNGITISKQKLTISDDIWRTSSRKLLTDSEKGNWTVKLIDEHGQLLNEKKFKVE